jgi:hypothetical protein
LVISPVEIPDVETKIAGQTSLWDLLPFHMRRTRKKDPKTQQREELDPGLELVDITTHLPRGRTRQLFAFDVDLLEPLVLLLPTQRFDGWHAELDGKPHPVFNTGPDLVGVHVPSGAHRLVFRWSMLGWHLATLIASLIAAVFVLGVWSRAIYHRARGLRYRR